MSRIESVGAAPGNGRGSDKVDQAGFDRAVAKINAKLDGSGITEWVSDGEVVDVNNIITGLKNNATRDAVLDRMADTGQMAAYVAEMYGRGVGSGVSDADRAIMFANIARQADGATMADFAQTLEASTNGADGYDRMQAFAASVGQHAAPQARAQFITALAPDATSGRSADFNGGLYNASIAGDADAAAMATVLGSLEGSPASARRALDGLSDTQLAATVDAAIERQTSRSAGMYGSASVTSHFDASGFADLSATIAANGSTDQRALAFDTAGRIVDDIAGAGNLFAPAIGNDEAVGDISDGLTALLTSDTNGVMRELTVEPGMNDGVALTRYVEQLLESGQSGTQTLARIQTELSLGNDLQGEPLERFNAETGGDPINARKLGMFDGAVVSAVDNSYADDAAKQQAVGDILGAVSSIVSGGVGVVAPWGGIAVGAGGEALRQGITAALAPDRDAIGLALYESAIPVDPATGEDTAVDIDPRNAFETTVGRVERINRHASG